MMAGQLFAQALPPVTEFTSPRAWAFGLIGIHEYLRRLSGDSFAPNSRDTYFPAHGTLRRARQTGLVLV